MKIIDLYLPENVTLNERQQLNEVFWMPFLMGISAVMGTYSALRYSKKIAQGTMTDDDWGTLRSDMMWSLAPLGIGGLVKGGKLARKIAKGDITLADIKNNITTMINVVKNDPMGAAAQTLQKILAPVKQSPANALIGAAAGTAADAGIEKYAPIFPDAEPGDYIEPNPLLKNRPADAGNAVLNTIRSLQSTNTEPNKPQYQRDIQTAAAEADRLAAAKKQEERLASRQQKKDNKQITQQNLTTATSTP